MVNARNASLPMEVVEEILLKLPVKSLKRFRCVCRSWLSSIDSPDFVKMHYRNSHNLNALVMSIPDLGPVEEEKVQLSLLCSETLSVREKLHSSFFEIIGESQGLVLLVHDSRAGLLNPATKEFKLIPESTLFRQNSRQNMGYRSDTWGFGYDRNSHDYKILHYCFQLHEAKKMRIELYTLSTNSWREICYPLENVLFPNQVKSCVYVNGCCHWWLNARKTILVFDMAEENFHIMDFPLFGLALPLCSLELRVFSNCLAFSNQKNAGINHNLFEIWVMKDYEVKDSWTKQLVLGPIPESMDLLGMWKTGEWFFSTINNRLALYNPENMVVKYLEMRSCRHRYPVFQSAVYIENLFSLNGTYLNPMYDEDPQRRMDSLEEAARNI